MIEDLGLRTPRGLGHPQHLPQERVLVGAVFEPVIVSVQTQAHYAQNQDLPPVHARAPGGFLVAQNLLFQQCENLLREFGVRENPLQAGEDGRQFVATAQRQDDFLNGSQLEAGLDGESLAHGR